LARAGLFRSTQADHYPDRQSGAAGRVNYTAVGDTVNGANRLEKLGKEIAPNKDVVFW
jgi:class 3 adenylate cyclase